MRATSRRRCLIFVSTKTKSVSLLIQDNDGRETPEGTAMLLLAETGEGGTCAIVAGLGREREGKWSDVRTRPSPKND